MLNQAQNLLVRKKSTRKRLPVSLRQDQIKVILGRLARAVAARLRGNLKDA
jgi:ribosomal protein L13